MRGNDQTSATRPMRDPKPRAGSVNLKLQSPGPAMTPMARPTAAPSPVRGACGSVTEGVRPGPHGAWLVSYEIGGQQLTDYWFYVHHRWVFDLVLSNPDTVKLYRMSPARYAAALGCAWPG